jgi:hypothetical protein
VATFDGQIHAQGCFRGRGIVVRIGAGSQPIQISVGITQHRIGPKSRGDYSGFRYRDAEPFSLQARVVLNRLGNRLLNGNDGGQTVLGRYHAGTGRCEQQQAAHL